MIAFHGDPAIKAKYLARVRAHREADQVVKGQYWEDGRGCAIGCSIHGSDHRKYETQLGIPVAIAYLEDGLFENLPNDKACLFPERFLEAIPVGADLALVKNRFLHWLLTSEEIGLQRIADEPGRVAIVAVAELYRRVIDGQKVAETEWDAAWAAARAARAAANAAAWAANAAPWDAARDAAIETMADKLMELLADSPVVDPAGVA